MCILLNSVDGDASLCLDYCCFATVLYLCIQVTSSFDNYTCGWLGFALFFYFVLFVGLKDLQLAIWLLIISSGGFLAKNLVYFQFGSKSPENLASCAVRNDMPIHFWKYSAAE
jgi:hypothetical protein